MPKRSLLGPETYITRPKEKETSIEEVLQDAQNIDFSQQDDHSSVAEFSKQHAARLTKVHTQTVDGELLHVLAKDSKKTLQHEKFLIWTLKKHPNLLGCLTNAGNTPLHTALENKNDDMVGLILTHTADQPKKVLFKAETKGGEHCLHSAINYNSRYTRDLIHLGVCYQSEVKIFDKMTHDDRDTPLSLAVQQEEDSSAVVDKLSVASSRTTHLAPPSWPLKNIDKLSSEDRPRNNSRNRQGLAGLSRKDTVEFKLTAADDRRDRPPPVAIAHAPETQKPASSTRSSPLQIVQDLVDAMPAALYQYRDKWGNTPYQARILHLERERRQRAPDALTADTPKINPQELVKQDDIARFIRSYCIRRLPRRDALTALYTVGEGSYMIPLNTQLGSRSF
ncbi:ankyrin repeat domain-containing protein [Aspergillus aculeatinus CBS 121060]|uniref:Uncharacterized protein n=1 Tax=Aspergillus aculeatinus CBS 121060 TaxID=1448322 RepID=A0ACD1GSR9_9EURO|nr:hypothetical protein BO66DRAFT_242317 [Aspergillus aculeatinus CBS 121060]RAH64373.1 hypothetical protein BO66DRAFT_242317 [Aspergillus aculeatinus CBS 121060]